jgi:hypothetical protein
MATEAEAVIRFQTVMKLVNMRPSSPYFVILVATPGLEHKRIKEQIDKATWNGFHERHRGILLCGGITDLAEVMKDSRVAYIGTSCGMGTLWDAALAGRPALLWPRTLLNDAPYNAARWAEWQRGTCLVKTEDLSDQYSDSDLAQMAETWHQFEANLSYFRTHCETLKESLARLEVRERDQIVLEQWLSQVIWDSAKALADYRGHPPTGKLIKVLKPAAVPFHDVSEGGPTHVLGPGALLDQPAPRKHLVDVQRTLRVLTGAKAAPGIVILHSSMQLQRVRASLPLRYKRPPVAGHAA